MILLNVDKIPKDKKLSEICNTKSKKKLKKTTTTKWKKFYVYAVKDIWSLKNQIRIHWNKNGPLLLLREAIK